MSQINILVQFTQLAANEAPVDLRESMKNRFSVAAGVIAGIWQSLGFGFSANAQPDLPVSGAVRKEAVVMTRASGTFEVQA